MGCRKNEQGRELLVRQATVNRGSSKRKAPLFALARNEIRAFTTRFVTKSDLSDVNLISQVRPDLVVFPEPCSEKIEPDLRLDRDGGTGEKRV